MLQLSDAAFAAAAGAPSPAVSNEVLLLEELSRAEAGGPRLSAEDFQALHGLAAAYEQSGKASRSLVLWQRIVAIEERQLGPSAPLLAGSLRSLAAALFQTGDVDRAKALTERSLAISVSGGKGDGLEAAETLVQLGVVLDTLQESQPALAALRGSLAIRERLLGTSDPAVAQVLTALADYYRTRGGFAEAGPMLSRALAIREQALGKDHPDISETLYVLGQMQQDQSLNELALATFQRSLAIVELAYGKDDGRVAQAVNALAALHVVMAQFDVALPMFHRAIRIYERSTGDSSIEVATAVNNLAVVFFQKGDYAGSLPLYERARTIYATRLGADHNYVASVLGNMGEASALIGEYGAALPLKEASLAMKEKLYGSEHGEVVVSLANLASVLQQVGQYDRATEVLTRASLAAEKTLGPDHADLALVLASSGRSWHASRRYDLALPLYERAARVYAVALGPTHPAVTKTLDSIAALQLDAGRAAAAQNPGTRALDGRIETLGPGHPDVARSWGRMAQIHQALGHPDMASEAWQSALPIALLTGNRDVLWQIARGLSRDHAARGEVDLAIFWGKQSIAAIQSLRSSIASLDKAARVAFLTDKRRAFAELAELLVARDRIAEAEQVMTLLKDEEYFEFVRRDQGATLSRGPVVFGSAERDADVELKRVQRLLELASYEPVLAWRLVRELTERLRLLLSSSPAQTNRPAVAEPNSRQRQLMLRASQGEPAAAFQYLSGDDALTLIFTTANGRTVRKLPISRAELAARIAAFRWSLQDVATDPRPLAEGLYDILIRPVRDELGASGARTLLLTLDGALRYLPFQALVQDGAFMVEKYAVVIDIDAARAPAGLPAGVSSRDATGLGVTRAFPEQNFPALPAVRGELGAIVNPGLLSGEIHLDEEFTRARLHGALRSRVVHVASHFRFIPGSDRSFLLLGDGSALTLRDVRIEKMDFSGLELLTLSACETAMGGGQDEEGAEVEGMGILAQRQGARSVLASLWSVADESTGRLMSRFYRQYQQPAAGASEALRSAQLSLLRGDGADRQFSHPYYWAPFILMSEGR